MTHHFFTINYDALSEHLEGIFPLGMEEGKGMAYIAAWEVALELNWCEHVIERPLTLFDDVFEVVLLSFGRS
jgi:hypothetical protein